MTTFGTGPRAGDRQAEEQAETERVYGRAAHDAVLSGLTPPSLPLRPERSPIEFSLLYAEVEREMSRVGDDRIESGFGYALGVTSAIPGEGKTTVALHLALSAASQTQKRVCVIDLGLGDDEIAHRVGAIGAGPGIVRLLEEGDTSFSAIQLRGRDDLTVIPAGRAPKSSARLARSSQLAALFHAARQQFEFVVVDLPAISTNNALPLIAHLDGVLMVARAGATPRGLTRWAIDHIDHEKRIGVVLNREQFAGPRWLGRWLNRGASVTEQSVQRV